MGDSARRTWRDVLRHGLGASRATVRSYYEQYRREHSLPDRCDNLRCRFHTEPLIWNGEPFRPIVDHINGANADNSPENLR